MKFNIWTFLFQVINFLVLLFILKRILYKPIREIIEKRRSLIRQRIEEAEKIKKEAMELKENYQHDMDGLHELKSRMIEKMNEEVEQDRNKLMGRAEEEAARVIEKEKAVFDTEKARHEAELKDKAIEAVTLFATNLLKGVSDEDLHKAIYEKLLMELRGVASHIPEIKEKAGPLTVDLITAYSLSEAETGKFREAIESLLSQSVLLNIIIDSSLIAGTKIKAHDMVYDLSLSGQIKKLALKLKETV
jgi:F-type H+-transporting ATPase subunit b